MNWLFTKTFSWVELGMISVVSALISSWGWWALLLVIPLSLCNLILEAVFEEKTK